MSTASRCLFARRAPKHHQLQSLRRLWGTSREANERYKDGSMSIADVTTGLARRELQSAWQNAASPGITRKVPFSSMARKVVDEKEGFTASLKPKITCKVPFGGAAGIPEDGGATHALAARIPAAPPIPNFLQQNSRFDTSKTLFSQIENTLRSRDLRFCIRRSCPKASIADHLSKARYQNGNFVASLERSDVTQPSA